MQMVAKRIGETTDRIPLRTDRFFAVNANWFFTTREGAAIGPYTTKFDAQTGLSNFIEFIQKAEDNMRQSFVASLLRN